MITADELSPVAPERALKLSPAESRALAQAKQPFWSLGRFLWFRRQHKPPELLGVQLSVAALQAELQELDREITETVARLGELEAAERDAVSARDKLALDVAWQSRERETARLAELEQQRSVIREGLAQRFEPEVDSWRVRCEWTVARWRVEDRENLEAVEQNLRQAESLIWRLTQREKNRAGEREALNRELDLLAEKAPSVSLARPEIDWNTEPLSLRDITARLESIQDLFHQFAEPQPALAP